MKSPGVLLCFLIKKDDCAQSLAIILPSRKERLLRWLISDSGGDTEPGELLAYVIQAMWTSRDQSSALQNLLRALYAERTVVPCVLR